MPGSARFLAPCFSAANLEVNLPCSATLLSATQPRFWPPALVRYNIARSPVLTFPACPQDPDLVTSWWTLQVSDPALSQPGPYEAAKQEPVQFWARDRNARVPWDALRLVLEAAVAEAPLGGTDAYRAAAAAGNHSWTVLPGRRLVRAGGAEQPC